MRAHSPSSLAGSAGLRSSIVTPDLLPHNADAERAVLGVILSDSSQFQRVSATISADDFMLAPHKRIWGAMEDIHRAAGRIDAVTVADRLKDAGNLQAVGGPTYLLGLLDALGSIIGAEHYCRIVKDDSIKRRAILAAQSLAKELQSGGESAETLARAERMIRSLGAETVNDRRLKTAGEIITERGGIDAFLHRSRTPGVPTRWLQLNYILGGSKKQQLIIIAARPGEGKTAAALDMAEHAAVSGIGAAVYSLEMNADELIGRLACARAQVDGMRWQRGELTDDEAKRHRRAVFDLTQLPLWIDDSAGCTVPAIYASLQQRMATDSIGLVIVDYLQLLQPVGKYGNRTEAVSAMTRELKLAAREFDVPFIVLSQLTRANEHQSRRPVLSDLRESGSIEQDANVVVFIHPVEGGSEFIVAKNRNGDRGTVHMHFVREFARFEEGQGYEQ